MAEENARIESENAALERAQEEKLKELMSRKNADGSGTLDVAQAREVLTDMGEEVDDAALVDTISTIGDGSRDAVAQEEFLKWWRQHNQDVLRGALESPEAREAREADVAEKARLREEKLAALEETRVAQMAAVQALTTAAAEYERMAAELAVAEESARREQKNWTLSPTR